MPTLKDDIAFTGEPLPEVSQLSGMVATAMIGTPALAIASAALSLLLWGMVSWEWVLGWTVLPSATLGLGSLAIEAKSILSHFHRDPPRQVEIVQTDRENVHIVDSNSRRIIEGVDSRDLAMFIAQSLPVGDWTQKRWAGTLMPSGRTCDTRYHQAMMKVLDQCHVIEGLGRGTTGHATTKSVPEAMRMAGIPGAN